MKRLYILVLSVYGFLLLAFIMRSGVLLAFSLPFLIYLTFGLIFGPDNPQLQITRTLSMERAQPGTEVQVTLEITNRGDRIERLLIDDTLPNGLDVVGGHTRMITPLPMNETATLKYSVSGPRGYYHLEDVGHRATDHLGIRVQEQV